ncbi:MAG: hypothetical protein QXT45_04145 [Candidatus Bilamarchaeaceae archaeon]
MSRYRQVHCLIWNDDKFPFLRDDTKLAFFHLLTTPFSNAIGLYKAPIEGLAAEIRWPARRYRDAIQDAIQHGIIDVDEKALLVWVKNFLKYNPPTSPNQPKTWRTIFDELPPSPLKTKWIQQLYAIRDAIPDGIWHAIQDAFPMPSLIQEQEQEQEQYLSVLNRTLVDSPPGETVDVGQSLVPLQDRRNHRCPHEEIIALYHKLLPQLPQVRVWNEQRRRLLQARWREDPSRQNLAWWEEFFKTVAKSPFLLGEKTDFRATLEWLVRPGNFAKVCEGFYSNEKRNNSTWLERKQRELSQTTEDIL